MHQTKANWISKALKRDQKKSFCHKRNARRGRVRSRSEFHVGYYLIIQSMAVKSGLYFHYGRIGCRYFKRGVQNQKDFCLRIIIPKKINDAGTGGPGGPLPSPQYLADHLTLFQPGRADYPHLLPLAPPMFFTFWHHCIRY